VKTINRIRNAFFIAMLLSLVSGLLSPIATVYAAEPVVVVTEIKQGSNLPIAENEYLLATYDKGKKESHIVVYNPRTNEWERSFIGYTDEEGRLHKELDLEGGFKLGDDWFVMSGTGEFPGRFWLVDLVARNLVPVADTPYKETVGCETFGAQGLCYSESRKELFLINRDGGTSTWRGDVSQNIEAIGIAPDGQPIGASKNVVYVLSKDAEPVEAIRFPDGWVVEAFKTHRGMIIGGLHENGKANVFVYNWRSNAVTVYPANGFVDLETIEVGTLPEEVQEPTCDALNVVPTSGEVPLTVSATVMFSDPNNLLEAGLLDWGNGETDVIDLANPTLGNTYEVTGTFDIQATLIKKDGGRIAVEACRKSVEVKDKAIQPKCLNLTPESQEALIGQPVTVTCVAQGAVAYRFRVDGGEWSAEQSSSEFTTTFTTAGDHTIEASIKDAQGNWHEGENGACVATIHVPQGNEPEAECLLLTPKESTLKVGEKITLTCHAQNAKGYRFREYANGKPGGWKEQTSNKYVFTAKTKGDFLVEAQILDNNGNWVPGENGSCVAVIHVGDKTDNHLSFRAFNKVDCVGIPQRGGIPAYVRIRNYVMTTGEMPGESFDVADARFSRYGDRGWESQGATREVVIESMAIELTQIVWVDWVMKNVGRMVYRDAPVFHDSLPAIEKLDLHYLSEKGWHLQNPERPGRWIWADNDDKESKIWKEYEWAFNSMVQRCSTDTPKVDIPVPTLSGTAIERCDIDEVDVYVDGANWPQGATLRVTDNQTGQSVSYKDYNHFQTYWSARNNIGDFSAKIELLDANGSVIAEATTNTVTVRVGCQNEAAPPSHLAQSQRAVDGQTRIMRIEIPEIGFAQDVVWTGSDNIIPSKKVGLDSRVNPETTGKLVFRGHSLAGENNAFGKLHQAEVGMGALFIEYEADGVTIKSTWWWYVSAKDIVAYDGPVYRSIVETPAGNATATGITCAGEYTELPDGRILSKNSLVVGFEPLPAEAQPQA
jgi:hypothetical protein